MKPWRRMTRGKKIDVNMEHLEDFNEAEVERRQWEDDKEAELKKKKEERNLRQK